MKKLLIIIAAIFAFGCSNDDAPVAAEPVEYFYSVTIKDFCTLSTAQTMRFCVTEEMYNIVKADVKEFREDYPDEPCINVGFIDINGNDRDGFYIKSERHTSDPCAD